MLCGYLMALMRMLGLRVYRLTEYMGRIGMQR